MARRESSTTMAIRQATPEETEAWLGNGLVVFGQKPPAKPEPAPAEVAPENERPEHPLSRIAREKGNPTAPPGHWIYDEGSSMVIAPPVPAAPRPTPTDPTPSGVDRTGEAGPRDGLEAGQAAHDRQMAAMSDADRKQLAKNLGDLMRAKKQGVEGPPPPGLKRRSG